MGNTAADDNSAANITPGTITVTALDATFESDADMAGMIEALQDLANQTQISKTWTEYYCAGDPAGDDLSPNYKKSRAVFDMIRVKRRNELIESRQICCNCEENGTPFEQYSSAATWYIRLNNDDGSLRSELRLGVAAGAVADAASQTICTDLFTAGAAVAGAMTGGAAAAAGMTLAGLFCGLIPTS